MVFITCIAKFHLTSKTYLIWVVQTFAKHSLMKRTHKNWTFYSIQLPQLVRNKERSRRNVLPVFWQSKWPLGKHCLLPCVPGRGTRSLPGGFGIGVWPRATADHRPRGATSEGKGGGVRGQRCPPSGRDGTGLGTGRGHLSRAGSCCPLVAAAPPRPLPGSAERPSDPWEPLRQALRRRGLSGWKGFFGLGEMDFETGKAHHPLQGT